MRHNYRFFLLVSGLIATYLSFAFVANPVAAATKGSEITKVSSIIQSSKTPEQVVSFTREFSTEELQALAEKYELKIVRIGRKGKSIIVTSSNEAKFTEFQKESIVSSVNNYQTYKIGAQTVDWGNSYVGATLARKNTPAITAPRMVIAVLDTGVQLDHPDLVGVIRAGGYDFINNDSDVTDDNGHGTHISGIIAANNNTTGTVGVAYGAKIIPYKVCNAAGTCDSLAIADAIDEATSQGVDVINMSFGGGPNELVQAAVNRATTAGIIVVASAGNVGSSACLYPGGYSNVVCVGAIDANETKPAYSNYGTELDVVAPGSNVLSLGLAGGTATMSGTSMSAAYYSGVVAIVRGIQEDICTANPAASMCSDIRSYTQFLVNYILIRDLGDYGYDQYFGNGAVDLGRLFLKTTVTYLNLPANINQNTAYLQQVDVKNDNNFNISISSCKVRGDNPSIIQSRLYWTTGFLVAPDLARKVTGTTNFESQYSLLAAYTMNAGVTARFNYSVTANTDNRNGDKIDYYFSCKFDDLSTPETESYVITPTINSVTVAQPDPVDTVYYRFATLQEGQTVSASSVSNTLDTLTLYNFNSSSMNVVGIYTLDRTTNTLAAASYTKTSATTYRVKPSYALVNGHAYSYVVTIDNTQTSRRVYKFFNFSTLP